MTTRTFFSASVALLFFVSYTQAGFDLIGSLEIPFPASSLRVADLILENRVLKFNYMLRADSTKNAVIARADFNLDSKDFQTTDQIPYENVKSADVYADEHVIIFDDNTVFQSNNGTVPVGLRYQNVAPDNLCAFGYEGYEEFAYSHIVSSQPFMLTSSEIGRQLGGDGSPGGIACKSLTEEQTFIFATSNRFGFALIFHKNGSSESLVSSSYFQMLVRPTVVVNGDYILYCANNLTSSHCYDNTDYAPFFPKFLNAGVLSLAGTVLNSQIVLAGPTLNNSLVILTYDNNRNIVDIAENKGAYSWDVPTSAAATEKYLVMAFSFFQPSSQVLATRFEIYEKNDKVFVPPTSCGHEYNWVSQRLLVLLMFGLAII